MFAETLIPAIASIILRFICGWIVILPTLYCLAKLQGRMSNSARPRRSSGTRRSRVAAPASALTSTSAPVSSVPPSNPPPSVSLVTSTPSTTPLTASPASPPASTTRSTPTLPSRSAFAQTRNGLSDAELDLLPLYSYNPRIIINERCPICMDDFQEREPVRCLPCSHAYHDSCITPWLTDLCTICPLCKFNVRGPPPASRFVKVTRSFAECVLSVRLSMIRFESTLPSSGIVKQTMDVLPELQPLALELAPDKVPGAFD